MALDPEVLYLDELSAGLDPLTAVELDELILKINESLDATMIIVTHELESIFKIADRVIMLSKQTRGIIAEGTPADLKEDSPDRRVRDFFSRRAPKKPNQDTSHGQ
jgi:phospholipid/cholesterol/gamma-HCH transport system ATP-binding protein